MNSLSKDTGLNYCMFDFVLTEPAQCLMSVISRTQTPEPASNGMVVIVSPDSQTGTLIGKPVEARVITRLKTKFLGEPVPNVSVYGFGIDTPDDGTVFKLNAVLGGNSTGSANTMDTNDISEFLKDSYFVVNTLSSKFLKTHEKLA